MIWPTSPSPDEPPLILMLSLGAYCTPMSARLPPPAMFRVLCEFGLLHELGSMNGAVVGTKQSGSLTTYSVMMSGGVGELGPEVKTGLPAQSIAAEAVAPPEPGGNWSPALSEIVNAFVPSKLHVLPHSSKTSATPGSFAS